MKNDLHFLNLSIISLICSLLTCKFFRFDFLDFLVFRLGEILDLFVIITLYYWITIL